jgi:hypothetical protein
MHMNEADYSDQKRTKNGTKNDQKHQKRVSLNLPLFQY